MGLFTDTTPTSSRRPLKRRSLGGAKNGITTPAPTSQGSQTSETPAEPVPKEKSASLTTQGSTETTTILDTPPKAPTPPQAKPQTEADLSDDDDDEDLPDLQSDTTFLYDRLIPLSSALGLAPPSQPLPTILSQIDAYVCTHHLDCFGITHRSEAILHHNRLIPFSAKAPRFLSIHSLKRKELERDFTDALDTCETCPRKELCLGRCALGFNCPTEDLERRKG